MVKVLLRKSIFYSFLLFATILNANSLVIDNAILTEKTVAKIEEIGSEVQKELNISIYISVINKLPEISIVEYEENLAKNLKEPFILLAFSKIDKKVDIINSESLNSLFNKDSILSDFIIPILVSKSEDENQKISAALLNGYAEIADQLAQTKNIKLNSSIGSEGRISHKIVQYFFYSLIFIFIAIFIYNFLIRKFKK